MKMYLQLRDMMIQYELGLIRAERRALERRQTLMTIETFLRKHGTTVLCSLLLGTIIFTCAHIWAVTPMVFESRSTGEIIKVVVSGRLVTDNVEAQKILSGRYDHHWVE